jgi:hypothetical protein
MLNRIVPMIALSILLAVGPARAQDPIPFPGDEDGKLPRRLALVIGIDYYRHWSRISLPQLRNAARDADLIAKVLERAGFSVTLLVSSHDNKWVEEVQILRSLNTFADKLKRAFEETKQPPIAFFYFAGHGLTAPDRDGKDQNFLLPSDFHADHVEDIPQTGLSLQDIVWRVASGSPALKIIAIDACRNEAPRLPSLRKPEDLVDLASGTTRTQDLAKYVENTREAVTQRTHYLFATHKGGTASDEGHFTRALVQAIEEALKEGAKGDSMRHWTLAKISDWIRGKFEERRVQQSHVYEPHAYQFRPLPTRKDFDAESKAWNVIAGMQQNVEKKETADAFFERRLCVASLFRQEYAYSYFMHRASAMLEKHGPLTCPDTSNLGIPMDFSALPIRLGIGTVAPWMSPIRYTAPKAGLLKAFQPAGTASLPSDVPLDRMLTASGGVVVRSAPDANAPPVDKTEAGELFGFESVSRDGNWVAVSIPRGKGYLPLGGVSGAYLPISVTLPIPNDRKSAVKVPPELEAVFELLGGAVVGDMTLEYSEADGPAGLSHALEVYESVTARSSPLQGANAARLVPLIVRVEKAKDSALEGSVRVTLSLLPLSKEVRSALAKEMQSWIAKFCPKCFDAASTGKPPVLTFETSRSDHTDLWADFSDFCLDTGVSKTTITGVSKTTKCLDKNVMYEARASTPTVLGFQ